MATYCQRQMFSTGDNYYAKTWYHTRTGTFVNTTVAHVVIVFPEFNSDTEVTVYPDIQTVLSRTNSLYNLIIVTQTKKTIYCVLDFEHHMIKWDGIKIPKKLQSNLSASIHNMSIIF